MPHRKILVSGGGIAGLTAALCLAKADNQIEIFERSPTLEPLGAGIQISPNAFHVLKNLGLGEKLLSEGDPPDAILMMNAVKGNELASIPLGKDIEDLYGAPYIVIHRADLQTILINACEQNPRISLNFGSEIVDAAIHKNGVTALVNSGGKIAERLGDILIGADGVHSRVRNEILELEPAKHSGKTAWRALIPAEQTKMQEALHNTMVWLGSKAHAVTYPIRDGKYLNVIAVTQEPMTTKMDKISRTDLKEKFPNWNRNFLQLLECDVEWSGWPLFEMSSVKFKANNTVALIGDASHAMLPFAAQGAAQAIEDAHVLAQCLSKTDYVEKALECYDKQRNLRVSKIMKTARSNGRIYHLAGIPAAVRNFGLRSIPGQRLMQKQDWIYRWKP